MVLLNVFWGFFSLAFSFTVTFQMNHFVCEGGAHKAHNSHSTRFSSQSNGTTHIIISGCCLLKRIKVCSIVWETFSFEMVRHTHVIYAYRRSHHSFFIYFFFVSRERKKDFGANTLQQIVEITIAIHNSALLEFVSSAESRRNCSGAAETGWQ